MRLDAVLELMMDRAQVQIVLHGLEGGLDLDELDIEPPPSRRRTWRSLSRSSVKLKLAPSAATSTLTRRHAAHALARAAPSFMSSSSRSRSMAARLGWAEDFSAGTFWGPSFCGRGMSGLTPAPTKRVHDPSGVATHGVALWSAGQSRFRSARVVIAPAWDRRMDGRVRPARFGRADVKS